MWAAKNPRNPNLVRPLVNATVVVIHHTNTTECFTHVCQNQLRRIQNDHRAAGYNDIAYNFVVTAGGLVYEGRGWKTQGETSSAPGLINRALIIAFHGTFEIQLPRERAMASFRALIKCGQYLDLLGKNVRYIAHRQLNKNTSSPGTALYRYMMTWPNFEPNPSNLIAW